MATLEISRLCRKPDVFSGNREKWCDFRMDMTNYMAAAAIEYLNDLQVAAATNEVLEDNGSEQLRQRSVDCFIRLPNEYADEETHHAK